MAVSIDLLKKGLERTLSETDLVELGEKYEGKVRDNYTTRDGRRVLVTTDRISAFDRELGTRAARELALLRRADRRDGDLASDVQPSPLCDAPSRPREPAATYRPPAPATPVAAPRRDRSMTRVTGTDASGRRRGGGTSTTKATRSAGSSGRLRSSHPRHTAWPDTATSST